MTVADTLYDVIKDNWGGGGYGGATPTFAITESVLSTDMVSADLIQVQAYSVREEPQVVNDVYTDKFYFCDIYISSKTTAAQLKLLEDEAEYLLRNTAMTSLQLVNIRKDHSVTKWEQARHAVRLIVEVVSLMSSGAITPATAASTDLTIGGDLRINGNDIKDSSGGVVISFDGAQKIDVLGEIATTIVGNQGGTLIAQAKTSYMLLECATAGQTIYYDANAHVWRNDTNTTILSLDNAGNLTIVGTYTGYFKPRRLRQATEPTPLAGEAMIWSDSDDDKVYWLYNDANAGVVKIELT